jgi:hypothetical protein
MLVHDPKVVGCTCVGIKNPVNMCAGVHQIDDGGVKAVLSPKKGEIVQLVIMDGCLCSNSGKRCDGVYLLSTIFGKYIVSVELKGTHAEDGVEQLSEMRKQQPYIELKKAFEATEPKKKLSERAFLVTYFNLGAKERMRLSSTYGIRFEPVLTQKGTGKMTDLRALL